MSKKETYQQYHIQQRDQSDCGVACLASLMKYFGSDISLEKLREVSGTSKEGTTLLGLYQAANEIGLNAEGFEAEIKHLKDLEQPAILHVILEGKLQHYVILYAFENDHFIISDPARGILKLKEAELEEIWQSKALLLVKPTEKLELKQVTKGKQKQWLIDIAREDFGLLAIATFLGIIISVLGISTAIFSQKLIDVILPEKDMQRLVLGLVLLAILLMARSGIGYLRTLLLLRQSKDFNNRIIKKFYDALLHLPKRFFDSRKTGELIARMNDTGRIQRTISFVLGDIVIQFLVGVTSLVFVFTYSWQVGLILLGFVPIYVWVVLRFNKPITAGQKEVMQAYAMNESNYVDTIQGVEVIKNQNKEAVFGKATEVIYGHFQEKAYSLGLIGTKYGIWAQVTGVIAIVSVLSFTSYLVLQDVLQVGELVAILSMAGGLFPAIEAIARANIQIREAKIAFDRMYEFTSIESEYVDLETEPEALDIHSINVKNLSFRFPGRKQLLKSINLEINKGEMVCLLGESGSGKSTFIQVLQKFYEFESGEIIVDGKAWANIYPKSLRDSIGIVPQETKIFNGSLLDNILLGETEVVPEKLQTFFESYGLDPFFRNFPQGYATILGEEGVNISGGQKQLVALARALWKKPKVLLLDEATSALDRKTEKFVLNLLQSLKKEMSIFLVTHRITTASQADKIYILEDGEITNFGNPNSLLESENFYSDFYKDFGLVQA